MHIGAIFSRIAALGITTNSKNDHLNNLIKLIVIGTIVTTFFLFTYPYVFPGGAWHFFDYANALAKGSMLDLSVVQRDVGYPLMILLSGYTINHSLIGITLIQAVMAILIPVLCYITVQPCTPKYAYYISLCIIMTLTPYYYLKWVHHDQTYIFYMVLSVCFLSVYINKKSTLYLYLMTFAVIATSLTRPAGNILFIFFIAAAYCYVRGNITRYLICIAIIVLSIFVYSHHRYKIFNMENMEHVPSYTGEQIFYNLYINSKEYGITLSPNLGKNLQAITDYAYNDLKFGPSKSIHIKNAILSEDFRQHYVYPFSTKEFINQIYSLPNWEYFNYLTEIAPDRSFLLASLEIVRAYPWYPVAYTLRNAWKLFYDPGYAHTRNNVNPFSKLGIQNGFIYNGPPQNFDIYSGLISKRAINEMKFDIEKPQHKLVKKIYIKIYYFFASYSLITMKILFLFMVAAWFAALICAISKISHSLFIHRFNILLNADKMTPYVITLSLLLTINILIASAFAEPDWRYHNFLMSLKIMLAGIGASVLLNAGNSMLRVCFPNFYINNEKQVNDGVGALSMRKLSMTILFVILMLISWVIYFMQNT